MLSSHGEKNNTDAGHDASSASCSTHHRSTRNNLAILFAGFFFTLLVCYHAGKLISHSDRFLLGNQLVKSDAKTLRGTAVSADGLATLDSIPINSNSSFMEDIISIEHDQSQSKLIIKLRGGARCPHPYLTARLSGPALVLVKTDWTFTQNKADNSTTLTSTYEAPLPGTYFLEIHAIHCYDFSEEVRKHPDPKDWSYNFVKDCTEDVLRMRLTEEGAKVEVSAETADQYTGPGFWKHQNDSQIVPLYTRFQPWECGPKYNNTAPDYCPNITSRARFEPYSFQWSERLSGLSTEKLKQPKPVKICAIGQSHSRFYKEAVEKKLNMMNNTHNITVSHHIYGLASQIVVEDVVKDNCDKIIIAQAQHPAKSRVIFDKYYKTTYEKLRSLLQALPKNVEVFARSLHYSPIGYMRLQCPVTDTRTMPVIDGYNIAIQRIVNELNDDENLNNTITYFEDHFIADPMWDSSHDFNHLEEAVQLVDSLYITSVILGLVDHKTQSETTIKDSTQQ